MFNPSLDLEGKQNKEDSFYQCRARRMGCNFFQNGKLYACATGVYIDIFNKYFNKNLPEIEGISIYKKENTPEIILNHIYNKPQELCKYCNVRKAEQSWHEFQRSNKDISEWIDKG